MFPKSLLLPAVALSFFAFQSGANAAAYFYSYDLDQLAAKTEPVTLDSGTPTPHPESPVSWAGGSISSGLTGAAGSQYGQIYIDLNALLGRDAVTNPVKFNEVVGFTYYTRHSVASAPLNWSIRIYTNKHEGDTGWYRYRFEGISPTQANTDWFLTDANTEGVINRVNRRVGSSNTNTNLADATLAGLIADSDFANEDILFYSLFVGQSGYQNSLDHYLTGLTFEMANGDTHHVALIPEPSTSLLIGVCGAALLLVRRRIARC